MKSTEPNISMEKMIEESAKRWAEHDSSVSYEDALKVTKINIPKLNRWK